MKGDLYWTHARFRSHCSGCACSIERGDRIFYHQATRSVLCPGDNCGGKASRDFEAHAFDEAVHHSQAHADFVLLAVELVIGPSKPPPSLPWLVRACSSVSGDWKRREGGSAEAPCRDPLRCR